LFVLCTLSDENLKPELSIGAPSNFGSVTISGSITSANVLDKLNSVVNTIPNTVYGKEDLLLYVPTNVGKAYQQALAGGAVGANGWNNQMNVGDKPFNFNGIEIVMCPPILSLHTS